jgi:hypothetical protein
MGQGQSVSHSAAAKLAWDKSHDQQQRVHHGHAVITNAAFVAEETHDCQIV